MNAQSEIKPLLNNSFIKEETRLVIPTKGGMVLEPFQLNHDVVITDCKFEIKQNIFNQLITKSDYELQLKSFMKDETSTMATNWPANIQISINDHLVYDKGDMMMKSTQKPLFLKKYCKNEANKLQLKVNQCCCQHLFVLQVVYCPTVLSALQVVVQKQSKPVEFCLTKIKQNFTNNSNNNSSSSNNNNNNNNMSSSSLTLTPSTPGSVEEISLEQTSFKLSLKCPISFKRINIPARGNECKHIQCFDLESFLILNADRTSWRCPLCTRQTVLENLEVDQYILNIINSNNLHDYDEIIIDANASWKPSNSMSKLIVKDDQTELSAYQSVTANNQFNSASSNYPLTQNNSGNSIVQNGQQQQMNSNLDNLMQGSPFEYHNQTPNNNQIISESLDPLAAIEKTIQQHDFGGIGRCTPSNNVNNNLLSSNLTAQQQQTELLNNNQSLNSPNSKSTINNNKSPICSNNPLSSNANTPSSMINNSPHTPNTPHTPLINHNSSIGSNCTSNLGPLSVISNHTNTNDINDLNFDPASIIDSETGQESLNDVSIFKLILTIKN